METRIVAIGQRVHCILHGGRDGVIYNIRGEQDPGSVRSLGGGCVVMGGAASFDVVFEDGTESKGLPESIVRGVQWRILDDVATADEIATLRGGAILKRQEDEAQRKAKAKAFSARVAELRADPRYSHLRQTTKDKYGSAARAAANIRAELKRAFPGVKFSVRSETYSGGDSIDVRWTDGPLAKDVENIAQKYRAGSFDGMTDCYNFVSSPWTAVFGDARHIFCEHSHSEAEVLAAVDVVKDNIQLTDRAALRFDGWLQGDHNDTRLVNDYLEKRGWFDPANVNAVQIEP